MELSMASRSIATLLRPLDIFSRHAACTISSASPKLWAVTLLSTVYFALVRHMRSDMNLYCAHARR